MATIDWTNKASVLSAVESWLDIFAEEIQDGLKLAAEILVGEAQTNTPEGTGAGPTGHLANSIQAGEPAPAPTGWYIQWGTPAEYGEVIECGRTPGSRMPPVRAIAAWVWGKRYEFDDVETEEDAMEIAFRIAKSIAAKGFTTAPDGPGKGWGMFEKAIAAGEPKIAGIMDMVRGRIEARCTEALGHA